jgi:hypothetical protein
VVVLPTSISTPSRTAAATSRAVACQLAEATRSGDAAAAAAESQAPSTE